MNGTPARATARTTPRNHKRKDRNVYISGGFYTEDDAATKSQQRTQQTKQIPSTIGRAFEIDMYIIVYIYRYELIFLVDCGHYSTDLRTF